MKNQIQKLKVIQLDFHTTKVTSNSVELTWNGCKDNVGGNGYQVLRNGEIIDTVVGTQFVDKQLQSSTEYTFKK